MRRALSVTPESAGPQAFIVAILRQALTDLRQPSPERDRSVVFFANADRHFEYLCGLVDADYLALQRAVWQQYPDLF